MIPIPEHIQQLRSYKPGKPIPQIVAELGLTETAVLWNNENNLGASPMAVERLRQAEGNLHLYPDPASIALRTLIANECGRQVEEVVVGNGSENILDNIFKAFCAPGEELLTSAGTFVAVYIWAASNNVPCVQVPLDEGYAFDLEGILARITEKTRIIYLANPNNPTGTMIRKDRLNWFLEQVPNDILVVVDEAYFEYACDLHPEYPDSTQEKADNVLTLRTFSKAYGIAGIRIGYGVGAPEVIDALMKVKMTFAPSLLAQEAGIGAIQDKAFLERTLEVNRDGIAQFYDAFESHGITYIPSFANFVMLDLGTAERVQELFHDLMQQGVFVRPLPAFGLPHCLRITVGTPEENALFLRKLSEVL